MSDKNLFDWADFYEELASTLLKYKNNRPELVDKVREVFKIADMKLPTLEKDNNVIDIDPFTVFSLFNKSSMKETNRINIVSAVKKVFGIKAPVPTSFLGVPLLNNQTAVFYSFIDERGERDIDDLWKLFESALIYVKDTQPGNLSELSKYFDLVIQKKGNGNAKITMGMFWIAPDSFINLDGRDIWYIYESGKLPEVLVKSLPKISEKIPFSDYFKINEKIQAFLESDESPFDNLKELSSEAWRYSEEINQQKRKKPPEVNPLTNEEKVNQEKPDKLSEENALADEKVDTVRYWVYSPGNKADSWDEFSKKGIMGLGWDALGDLSKYKSRDEMKQKMQEIIDPNNSHTNASLATWQFANVMKEGDIIFAKKGRTKVLGRGVVESDYEYDPERKRYKNVRRVNWTNKEEQPYPGNAPMKTLTDMTPYTEYVEKLKALYEEDSESEDEQVINYPPYSPDRFLQEVYITEDNYQTLTDILKYKKNLILQGPPGVGKTFTAKRLAYSMIGCKDQSRVQMVQFHQSYSYEDFIMGFRPNEAGFELRHGVFYDFCKKAQNDRENDYFFIIDEINRGNLSKIFGELFMLIENDKRDIELQLLYSNEKFTIPGNIYIIGMMNTADRSLALMDYALRRRFGFFEMKPGFDSDGFYEYQKNLSSVKFNRLVDCVKDLNAAIARDESLGEGFLIGHSFLCNLEEASDTTLSRIVEFELIPLLKEYWFDEPVQVRTWSNNLRSAIK